MTTGRTTLLECNTAPGAKWRELVKFVQTFEGTIKGFDNKIPTRKEALQLLKDAGINMDPKNFRIEDGHGPLNPHDYPHINYPNVKGQKATIRIQSTKE